MIQNNYIENSDITTVVDNNKANIKLQINNISNCSIDTEGVSNNNSLIDKQYNFFISVVNKDNKTIITLDTDKFKEDYNNHYFLYVEDFDGFFDDKDSRYTEFLLSELLDLKLEFLENKSVSFEVVTKDYSELKSRFKETKNVDLKLEFLSVLKDEKTKCKELTLLFSLIFDETIYIDIPFIMNCLNNLIVNDLLDDYFIDQNNIDRFRDYISFFEAQLGLEKDLEKLQELLESDDFEDLFIPLIVILSNKRKKGFERISVIYPVMKQVGILNNTDYSNLLKDNYFKAKLYAHVIRRLVDDNLIACEIDYSDYFSFINPNKYIVTLNFNSEEMELRKILKTKGFSSPILDRYNKLSKNPI